MKEYLVNGHTECIAQELSLREYTVGMYRSRELTAMKTVDKRIAAEGGPEIGKLIDTGDADIVSSD